MCFSETPSQKKKGNESENMQPVMEVIVFILILLGKQGTPCGDGSGWDFKGLPTIPSFQGSLFTNKHTECLESPRSLPDYSLLAGIYQICNIPNAKSTR